MPISPIEETLEFFRKGETIVLVDEDEAESEGFLCAPAEKITSDAINFMLSYARGVVYLTLTEERMKRLGIAPMLQPGSAVGRNSVGIPISAKAVPGSGVSLFI